MTDADATPRSGADRPDTEQPAAGQPDPLSTASRDIAEVPAVEIISTAALHLMSAAAVNLGLAADLPDHKDLDEARSLIDSLAGLLDAAAPSLGHHHAAPLKDGLRSLQLAFREASSVQDEAGQGPGEKYTGAVFPAATQR
ncbi:DUF1844 domain-containing protein [Kribbella sp. NPDC049584]|uniref:DUF1844 domain-containing protein n=1 Tax=Kribbella sp. NPDC049584 TaxID=3154833 RepID=UPI00343C22C0